MTVHPNTIWITHQHEGYRYKARAIYDEMHDTWNCQAWRVGEHGLTAHKEVRKSGNPWTELPDMLEVIHRA